MPAYVGDVKAVCSLPLAALAVLALSAMCVACRSDAEAPAAEARPVRTLTVEKREAGVPITLTGRIEAEDEVALAFRISGRILESDVKLGDRVEAGQVVARLESQNELNALRSAQANLAAAQGQLTQARNHFRTPGHAAPAGLDHARQSRSGDAGAADRSIAGRRRRSAIEVGARSGELHRAQGGCARCLDGIGPRRRARSFKPGR